MTYKRITIDEKGVELAAEYDSEDQLISISISDDYLSINVEDWNKFIETLNHIKSMLVLS